MLKLLGKNSTDFQYYNLVLDDEKDIVYFLEYTDFLSVAKYNEILGVSKKDSAISIDSEISDDDFVFYRKDIEIKRPFKLIGVPENFYITYSSRKTGKQYFIARNRLQPITDFNISNLEQWIKKEGIHSLHNVAFDVDLDDNQFFDADEYLDSFSKDLADLQFILDNPILSLYEVFDFSVKGDCIDLSKLPITNVLQIDRTFHKVHANKVIFFALDLSWLFAFYLPFGSNSLVTCYDFSKCFNDIIEERIIHSNLYSSNFKLRLGFSKQLDRLKVVIIPENAIIFRKYLLRDNTTLTYVGHIDIKQIDTIVAKYILMRHIGHYLFTV